MEMDLHRSTSSLVTCGDDSEDGGEVCYANKVAFAGIATDIEDFIPCNLQCMAEVRSDCRRRFRHRCNERCTMVKFHDGRCDCGQYHDNEDGQSEYDIVFITETTAFISRWVGKPRVDFDASMGFPGEGWRCTWWGGIPGGSTQGHFEWVDLHGYHCWLYIPPRWAYCCHDTCTVLVSTQTSSTWCSLCCHRTCPLHMWGEAPFQVCGHCRTDADLALYEQFGRDLALALAEEEGASPVSVQLYDSPTYAEEESPSAHMAAAEEEVLDVEGEQALQDEEAASDLPFHYGSHTYAEGSSPSAHMAVASSETEDEGLQVLRDEAITSAASNSFWEDHSIDSDNNVRSRSRSPLRTFASYHEVNDTAGQQPSEAGDYTQMCSAPCSGIVMRGDGGLHPSSSIHGPCNRLCRLRQGHRSGIFSQCDCLLDHALSEDLDGRSGEPGPSTTGSVNVRQRPLAGGLTPVSPRALALAATLGGLCGTGLSQREVQSAAWCARVTARLDADGVAQHREVWSCSVDDCARARVLYWLQISQLVQHSRRIDSEAGEQEGEDLDRSQVNAVSDEILVGCRYTEVCALRPRRSRVLE